MSVKRNATNFVEMLIGVVILVAIVGGGVWLLGAPTMPPSDLFPSEEEVVAPEVEQVAPATESGEADDGGMLDTAQDLAEEVEEKGLVSKAIRFLNKGDGEDEEEQP